MTLKLLTEYDLEFLSFKGACLSLHMSKCHIVGNHMSRLISVITIKTYVLCAYRKHLTRHSILFDRKLLKLFSLPYCVQSVHNRPYMYFIPHSA